MINIWAFLTQPRRAESDERFFVMKTAFMRPLAISRTANAIHVQKIGACPKMHPIAAPIAIAGRVFQSNTGSK